MVPGWEIAVTWLRAALCHTRRWLRAAAGWAGRRRQTRGGRALLAGLLVLALAVPAGLVIGLVAAFRDDGDDSAGLGLTGPRVLRLGVMAPLSGPRGDVGVAVRNAVALAVEEAKDAEAIPGWTIELVEKDDLARPDGGAAAAEAFADDPAMIGVVGPLSSTVARVALPVLDEAGISVISPANSEPQLTGQDTANGDDEGRERPFSRYFRLSGSDMLQARVGADYAVDTMGRSRILVIDGGPRYGPTLADRFASFARDAGADILASFEVRGDVADKAEVDEVAEAIRTLAPDLVYTTTGPEFAGALRRQMAEDQMASVPLLGTDALLRPQYLDAAGEAAEGDLVTDLAVPVSRLPAAGAFAAAYAERWGPLGGGQDEEQDEDDEPDSGGEDANIEAQASGAAADWGGGTVASAEGRSVEPRTTDDGGEADGDTAGTDGTDGGEGAEQEPPPLNDRAADMIPAVAAYAYDAARALLRAAASVLPARQAVDDGARAAIAAEVGRDSFPGVTGMVAFDEFGDLIHPPAVIYTVLGGRFVPLLVTSGS
ncbi:MAG: branched-chain amino acid ABC transporter substrate-binding protein [Frankia sp.]|nr:branched-chain amino acid ABC transporter substrate-binding protein [Frankia sp.]